MAREDKGKIRIMMVELEGSNQTVQEGLRTLSATVARSFGVMRAPAPAPISAGGPAGAFRRLLNYRGQPAPPLAEEDSARADRLLREAGPGGAANG